MQVGSRRDRGDEVASRDASELFGYGEGDGHGRDADMAAGTDVVVVEHVSEAAIDEGCPGGRCFEAEAEYGTFRASAERLDIFRDHASLRREATGADRHAESIEDDLFDQFDELPRQHIIRE
jgi:hypothetical protein